MVGDFLKLFKLVTLDYIVNAEIVAAQRKLRKLRKSGMDLAADDVAA